MEKAGIIEERQVSFGNKGSSVLYAEWPISEDEVIRKIKHPELGLEEDADQTVETVITFSPTSDKNALKIAHFLLKKTNSNLPDAIPKSWETPDIRATKSLDILIKNPSTREAFQLVVSNFLEENGAELIVMRQKSEFKEPEWHSQHTMQNTNLVEYLANTEVPK